MQRVAPILTLCSDETILIIMMKKLLVRYELLILMGLLIATWSFLNVIGITNTSSDIFWSLAGLGLATEAFIELWYERRADDDS